MGDNFWINDINILYSQERLMEIFPKKEMTRNEKMNALSRLSIYMGVILAMYKKDEKFMYIPLVVVGLLVFLMRTEEREGFKMKDDCVKPEKNNPFMNVLMTDYTDKPERKAACGVTEEEIKSMMEENFDFNLYKDTDDLFDRNNSQRQFYTTPNTTIPNDQESYAKWLYKSKPTCKEESIQCSRNIHERLQSNRFEFPNSEVNPVTSKKDEDE